MRRVVVLACLLAVCCTGGQSAHPCSGHHTSIVVEAERHLLHLCKNSRSTESFNVAFGRSGLGKQKEGDNKTPVGTFALGRPRRSMSGFHKFIEVKVPRKMGVNVGIHGPKKGARWMGDFTTAVDWTQGCIAVGTVEAIDKVAVFVRDNRVKKVHIVRQ